MVNGLKIKQAREELKLSQIQLSEKIGITQSVLSRYEDDSVLKQPSVAILCRIAKELNKPIDFFIDKC